MAYIKTLGASKSSVERNICVIAFALLLHDRVYWSETWRVTPASPEVAADPCCVCVVQLGLESLNQQLSRVDLGGGGDVGSYDTDPLGLLNNVKTFNQVSPGRGRRVTVPPGLAGDWAVI